MDEHKASRILAISGSLRAASSNTSLVQAAVALAPKNVEVIVFGGLADLPHFNPDLDGEVAPPAVANFRLQLRSSDGILISSPEYAHGVPGALKNALDWIVSSGEFMDKPVALINVNPHATYAQASLAETLTVMMAKIIAEASIAVPLQGRKLDAAGIVSEREISGALRASLAALAQAIEDGRTEP